MNKYRAKKTEVDGIVFHSKKEAERYIELRTLLKGGKIKSLELQPRFDHYITEVLFTPEGTPYIPKGAPLHKVAFYKADFRYEEKGKVIVEDVKGVRTSIYRLKKKMVEAQYNIRILET